MDLGQATGQFADDLMKLVVPPGHLGHVLVSPMSLMTVLSMLLAATRNDSKSQLIKVLHLHPSGPVGQSNVEDLFYCLISDYEETEGMDEQYIVRNKVILSKDHKLKTDLNGTFFEKYKAQVDSVDLKSSKTMKALNKEVNKSTDGLIDDLVDFLGVNSTATILSSFFFKSPWTMDEPTVNSSASKKVANWPFKYTKIPIGRWIRGKPADLLEFVSLPISESSSMVQFAPMFSPISSFIGDPSKFLRLSYLTRQIHLPGYGESIVPGKDGPFLPFPKLNFCSKLVMNEYIDKLGAIDIFSRAADISLVNESVSLKVSSVVHLNCISIDASGIKAASVSAVETVVNSARNTTAKQFEKMFNRQLTFSAYDSRNNLSMFLGKMDYTRHKN